MDTLYDSKYSLVEFDPDTSTYTIQAGKTATGNYRLTYSSCMAPEHVVVYETQRATYDEHDFFFFYFAKFDHMDTEYKFDLRFIKGNNTWEMVSPVAQKIILDLHKAVAVARKHFHEAQQRGLVERSARLG